MFTLNLTKQQLVDASCCGMQEDEDAAAILQHPDSLSISTDEVSRTKHFHND